MSRYIDADALLSKYGKRHYMGEITTEEYYNLKIPLDYAPTADVKPVVRGEWMPREEKNLWECSVCGNIIFSEDEVDKNVYHAYCGKCGSDMRGDKWIMKNLNF